MSRPSRSAKANQAARRSPRGDGVRRHAFTSANGADHDALRSRLTRLFSEQFEFETEFETEVESESETEVESEIEVQPPEPSLRFLFAKDHFEDNFLVPGVIWADATRIYLAGYSGRLHVLARDADSNFAELESLPTSDTALSAVRGDANRLYVASRNGRLTVYDRTTPLTFITTVDVVPYGIGDLALDDGALFVAGGSAHIVADADHIYLARLNESDLGYRLDPASLTVMGTFEGPFEGGEDGRTVVYARATGARVGALGWPESYQRAHDFPALARLPGAVVEFVPGCCGRGIDPFDPDTLAARPQLALPWTNTVVVRSAAPDADWIIGTEAGHVLRVRAGTDVVDAEVDLRGETGHLGLEDIEIRAVWADANDDYVFAGSSWGNAQSRGPTLPSFFVLVAPRER